MKDYRDKNFLSELQTSRSSTSAFIMFFLSLSWFFFLSFFVSLVTHLLFLSADFRMSLL